jgi:hypothetical protein
MSWTRLILVAAAVIAPLGIPPAASAKVLEVGPNKPFKQPSEAIAAAASGDDVRIDGGQYFDCASIRQDNLTIEGIGPDAVLTDKTCSGKAILVIDGKNVTVRNLTLQRARVVDRNGAGIRAEGGDLTVENTRFINNENGILSADNPAASFRITGSSFIGNGHCDGSCAHALYIGHAKLLHVDHTQFFDTHVGHNIKSRALRTEIIDCDIEDGPTGSSSYLIEAANGGTLIVERNKMEKGKLTENWGNTIMIGSEGVTQPTEQILIRNNNFTNDENRPTTFVTNRTATPAELVGNVLVGQVRPLEGDGTVH